MTALLLEICVTSTGGPRKNAMTELCKLKTPTPMQSIPDTVGKHHTITSSHANSTQYYEETSFQCEAKRTSEPLPRNVKTKKC